jgi:predicted RNA-binding Zn ribbon-like protein
MEREDAPGALAVVEAFVNTADLDAGTDELGDAPALAAWLGERGLLDRGTKVTARDHARALEVREALRALAVANNGEALDPAAPGRLDRAAADAQLAVRFGGDGGTDVAPRVGGVDGALGRLLAIVQAAQADGTWARFKACSQHTCRWAFYDRSRNRSSRWCEMAVCGNRAKAREFRRRGRAT